MYGKLRGHFVRNLIKKSIVKSLFCQAVNHAHLLNPGKDQKMAKVEVAKMNPPRYNEIKDFIRFFAARHLKGGAGDRL